ncbi:MAG: beta-ketoacyl-[acyl-carrier-protein] synthase family protein [Verrucomicrobiales bacterium]|nr:beta-ketoacyl-[acyl-carrier-protein] synthase family protein [Verrucomicrobiales bacterium]
MNQVVVTGLGFISSIGNSKSEVTESLKTLTHGFAPFPHLEGEDSPVQLYGSIKEFDTSSTDPEDWVYPERFKIKRQLRRTMSPNVLFAHCAALDAISDAGLTLDDISNPETGLYSASAGSAAFQSAQMTILNSKGVKRLSPFAVVNSTVGTINFNLVASLKIKGAVCGLASACASSAHALGFAFDEIRSGRQERMLVIGAEDGDRASILPFAAMRALSPKSDPREASCPFDVKRSGFVGTGGAAALILESREAAEARKAEIYAEFSGWGQAADGYNPAMSHPEGEGLARSMNLALKVCDLSPADIDYVNAHGTSTPVGDLSEVRALKTVFGEDKGRPEISSTKALTGHGLSMAGALEAGICCLAIKESFTPGSAHITKLVEEAESLNIIRETKDSGPGTALSSSSGFGGANVSLIFRKDS